MANKHFIGLIFAVCVTISLLTESLARPHYIAIRSDDLQFIDLTPHKRVPRDNHEEFKVHVLEPAAIDDNEESASVLQPQRDDYTDFGAHTGNNGAFGWYADYPVRRKR